jgi:hypothetical protein
MNKSWAKPKIESINTQRRSLLCLLAASPLLANASLTKTVEFAQDSTVTAATRSLAMNHASIQRIASIYLEKHPEWNDSLKLQTWLSTHLDKSNQDADSLIKEMAEEDLQRGDHLLLDGWLIAATEARLCAYLTTSTTTP